MSISGLLKVNEDNDDSCIYELIRLVHKSTKIRISIHSFI